jgi:hypothetical protein
LGLFVFSVFKGCCRGSKGCHDQLQISKAMLQECSSRKKIICPLFWDVTQRRMLIPYRRFETTSRVRYSRVKLIFDCLTMEDGTDTSVRNCYFTLCNIPEERRYHLHRGGSLKSRTAGRQIDVFGVDWS